MTLAIVSNGGGDSADVSVVEAITAVATVQATDPDGGPAPVYAIDGGADAALFTIDAATGALSFKVGPDFEIPADADLDNIYEVIVSASDGVITDTQTLSVTVTDALPTIIGTSYTGTIDGDVFTVDDGQNWTVLGLEGYDVLTTGGGNDTIDGGSGNDTISSGAGDDTILVGPGGKWDSVDGGPGNDLVIATAANVVIGLTAIAGVETVSAGGHAGVSIADNNFGHLLDFSATALIGIGRIDGAGGNDTITGSAGDDTILGGIGDDVLHGGADNDTLIGGGGADQMFGDEGDDTFVIGLLAGKDTIDGGAGFDTVVADADGVVFSLAAMTGIEAISAGGHADVRIAGTSAADTIDLSAYTLTGITMIAAGSGADTVIGSAGDDTIDGGTGADSLNGGGGDDTFLYGALSGKDTIVGGAGHDTVKITSDNLSLNVLAWSEIEAIDAGGRTGVKIVGTSAAETLNFNGVTLTGIGSIDGGSGNDTVTGSAGADTIIGGNGADLLAGGGGNDRFVFRTISESRTGANADHVVDFATGDLIDLSLVDADGTLAGVQHFTFIGSAAFTGLGQLRVGSDDGHVALFGNTAGGLSPEFEIVFDNDHVVVAGDLVLV